MPPLIAVTASLAAVEGRERVQVNSSYVKAIVQAGGVPLLLPAQIGREAIRALLPRVDGLLLTGGGDVDPERYGERPAGTKMGTVLAARDKMEIEAARQALDGGLPILAICRGMQVLNVALGGTLYQDIPADFAVHVEHGTAEARHAIRVEASSRLARLLGEGEIEVNSRHHQAVKAPGKGLCAVAWTDDGIVEGVELPGDRFVVGVEWHPEDMLEEKATLGLFAGFVAACARRSKEVTPGAL
jgi:putative glutamine amidotransferase